MLKQFLNLKLSQKLSPQQIQLMKLIQLPTQAFEEAVKQELEENPALDSGKETVEDDYGDDSYDDYNDSESINAIIKADIPISQKIDLIAEYNTDKIAEATIARNRNYARQISDMVDEGIKSRTDIKKKVSVEDFVKKILKFDPADPESKEILFTTKIEIFGTDKLKKSTDKEYKKRLRSAKTPIELLAIYNELND